MVLSVLQPRSLSKESEQKRGTFQNRVGRRQSREAMFHCAVSIVLCTGFITAIHLGLLQRAESRAALLSLERNAEFGIPLQLSVTDSETQMFLQALLKLPQVRSIDIQGEIHVTLRSILDYETFFTFLKRPELSSILSPSYASELPEERDRIVAAMGEESDRASLATFFLSSAIVLLFAYLLLRLHDSPAFREARLLRLFGAGHGTQLRPFLTSEGAHLGLAFLLSIPLVLLFLFAFGWALPRMNLALPMLLGEGIILSVLLFLAAEFSLSSLFRNSWDA